ncbi:TetR/AcrR family transcriptional regulator [Streptomyces sp. 4N509B]|uniref:TetR/AcrR family transcriptional regulator n=1 Tax=Streptomyces sp. 4N509B TaxID=3457413 RepID=UPI003FD12BEF
MARPPRTPHAVWFDEERPRKPRLSRERIARAAVELLDAEGVAGVSMRRLAARLGSGTMSVYEYVGGREDVLDLALDTVFGEIELDEPDGTHDEPDGTHDGPDGAGGEGDAGGRDGEVEPPWREALTRHLTRSRAVMRRHPWVPALAATRPLVGPNALARSEAFYAQLVRAGLTGPHLVAAVGALSYYVQGFVAAENTFHDRVRDPADEAELRRATERFIADQGDRYPTLTRHAQLGNDDFDGLFLLGVTTILDGIEAGSHPVTRARRA